jgi:hypothetical protein
MSILFRAARLFCIRDILDTAACQKSNKAKIEKVELQLQYFLRKAFLY